MHDLVAGVDLGGTKIYTALADMKGNVLAEMQVPTEADKGVEGVLDNICKTLESVSEHAESGSKVRTVGVGAPGPLNPRTGMVYQAPNLGWKNVPLARLLEERTGVKVIVDNDANLAALGEKTFGAGAGVQDLIYITVSTGVGGGLILDGSIYHGATGGAGEVGHIPVKESGPVCGCGNRGCLEAVASGTAMARRAMALISEGRGRGILEAAGGRAEKVRAEHIARAAAAGDPEALVIFEDAGRILGRVIAGLVNLLNPALVVLGGGVMNAGLPLWEPIQDAFNHHCLGAARDAVRIVPARLGKRAGVMGALALAISVSSGRAGGQVV